MHIIEKNDRLWIYRDGSLLSVYSIDRAHDAVEWGHRHGMTCRNTVTAENGHRFELWEGNGFACAIPCK